MKVCVVQQRVKAGSLNENLEFVLNTIAENKTKSDIIVFGELCLSGYLLNDLDDIAIIDQLLSYNDKIISASKGCMVIWGNIGLEEGQLKNCGYVAHNQTLIHLGSKQFDSSFNLTLNNRYFHYDQQVSVDEFDCFGLSCTLVINDDLDKLNLSLTDLIIHLNSQPYHQRLEFEPYSGNIISVNGVSLENDGKHFTLLNGLSYVHFNGVLNVLNDKFESEIKLIDLNNMTGNEHVSNDRLLAMMLKTIHHLDQELFSFKPNWIVGLSGGLDSSVSASLLTLALGSKRIIGLNMATSYNSLTTKNNANHLAEKLGIRIINGSIEPLVQATKQTCLEYGYPEIGQFNLENVQARLRGHLLSTVASIENGLVSNNTNKVECAFGYGTMYGDTIGAIGFLSDCTKLVVGQLGHGINALLDDEVIPHDLLPIVNDLGVSFGFKPSAELKENQVDPMKWGYHDYVVEQLLKNPDFLIDHLRLYLFDKFASNVDIYKYVVQYDLLDGKKFIEDLDWVVKQFNRSIFKRIQTQPSIVISDCFFGVENQRSLILSDQYIALREEVLRNA